MSRTALRESSAVPLASPNDEEKSAEAALEPWVRIQSQTFTNWVNEKLRALGGAGEAGTARRVQNLRHDLSDGIVLCALVQALTGSRVQGRVLQRAGLSHHEASANLCLALDAVQADRVKLVNIGAEDIYAGNLKLILGLVWSLVRRYQIGSESRLPPKRLMLAWLNAALHPHRCVNNFSGDWNSGAALLAVKLSSLLACERAVELARDLCGVPMLLSAADLSSPYLDELSGMTYLSYFMAQGCAGYEATLRWVQDQVAPLPVRNFDVDWNSGSILSALVNSLGGRIPNWPHSMDNTEHKVAIQTAMRVSKETLGVDAVLSSRDMMSRDVDHIGVMAYAAWLKAKAKKSPAPLKSFSEIDEKIYAAVSFTPPPAGESEETRTAPIPDVYFKNDKKPRLPRLHLDRIPSIQLQLSPSLPPPIPLTPSPPPPPTANHLLVKNAGLPFEVLVEPAAAAVAEQTETTVHVVGEGLQSAVVGKETSFEVNVGINFHKHLHCSISNPAGQIISHAMYTYPAGYRKVVYTPLEEGVHSLSLRCDTRPINGSPFSVHVRCGTIRVSGLSERLRVGTRSHFLVDASEMQPGQLELDSDLPVVQVDRVEHNSFRVTLEPRRAGQHDVTIKYNSALAAGSPFVVQVFAQASELLSGAMLY